MSQNKPTYRLVHSTRPGQVEEEVNKLLADGYVLLGPPIAAGTSSFGHIYQAMILQTAGENLVRVTQ